MESDKLKDSSLDELIDIYEELNNFVNSLSKELNTLMDGENNA